ncbi:MAG TPA: hypothetical protein DHN29_15600, partial [Cytophagales bacterium]|nr:hypothetical protein [Cytophagales bacterium]
ADAVIRGLAKGLTPVAAGARDSLIQSYAGTSQGFRDVVEAPFKLAVKARRNYVERAWQKLGESGLPFKELDEKLHGFEVDDQIDRLSLIEEWRSLNTMAAHMDTILNHGTIGFIKNVKGLDDLKVVGEGLNPILKYVHELGDTATPDFKDYMKWRMARDVRQWRVKQGEKKMLTARTKSQKAKAQKLLEANGGISKEAEEALRIKVQTNRHYTNFTDVWDNRLSKFNDNMLNFLKEEQVIDQSMIARFQEVSNAHAFFFRASDEAGGMVSKSRQPLKKDVTKSQRKLIEDDILNENMVTDVDDMYMNMFRGYFGMLQTAMRNRFRRRLYDTLAKLPKAERDLWAKKIPLKQEKSAEFRIGGKEGVRSIDTVSRINKNGKLVKENWAVSDAMLHDAMAMFGPQVVGDWAIHAIRGGQWMKRLLTDVVTLNPEFFIQTNFIRDSVAIPLLSRAGTNPILSPLKGLNETVLQTLIGKKHDNVRDLLRATTRDVNTKLTDREAYDLFVRQGGSFGTRPVDPSRTVIDSTTGKAKGGLFRRSVEEKAAKAGIGPDTDFLQFDKNTMPKFLSMIEGGAARFEYANRVAEFKALVEQGWSPRKAAIFVRDIGADFSNTGSSGIWRTYASTVPFLNAHIQGIGRTLRGLGAKKVLGKKLTKAESDEAKRVWRKLSILSIASVGLHSYHKMSEQMFDDPNIKSIYDNLSNDIKDKNWVFIMPKGGIGELPTEEGLEDSYTIWKIPKPFDFAVIPTLAVKATEALFDEREKSFIGTYLSTVIQDSGRVGDASLLPQAVRAAYEVSVNENAFGRPITPIGMERIDPEFQFTPWTSPTARKVGEWFGFSPIKVEHIYKSWFGTIGALALEAMDEHLVQPITDMPARAEKRLSETFWIRRLVEQTPLKLTQSQEELYDKWEETVGLYNGIESLLKNPSNYDLNKYEELINTPEYEQLTVDYVMFSSVLEDIANINSAIKLIANRDEQDGVTPHDKMLRIHQLIQQRNLLVEDFMSQHDRHNMSVRRRAREDD